MNIKKAILIIIILLAAAFGFYFLLQYPKNEEIPIIQPESNQNQTMKQAQDSQDLKIEVLKEGAGKEAKNGDTVTVHYTGMLENGAKFDSSLDGGTPFVFVLGAGQVIKGWDMGVKGMKVGEKRKLIIPPQFGYGETGTPGGPIPPNATLIFEVELLNAAE